MKNKNFDVRINIEVKVMPQKCEGTEEQLEWEKLGFAIQRDADLLADSLRRYYEYKIEKEIRYI